MVLALDTFSVGWPTTLAAKIFGKNCLIRTGGDFLWEGYVERTKKKILLRNFYQTEIQNLSLKEKLIFRITKWTLQNATKVIFSTEWQKQIFIKAYDLKEWDTDIIENYYGEKTSDFDYEAMVFIGSTRRLVWKNLNTLQKVFDRVAQTHPHAALFLDNLPHDNFLDKLGHSYAVVLISLGDISPNMILDAVRLNRPFICTREIGIYDRIKEAGLFVDPLDEKAIEGAILNLLSADGYQKAKEKVRNFNFTHNWGQIAKELLRICETCPATKKNHRNFLIHIFKSFIAVRYLLCGTVSAGFNILTLYLLTDIVNIWYLYSSIIAFIISLVVSFVLQKFVVFEDREINGLHRQFWKFFMALTLGTVTNTLLIYVFTDIIGIWYIFSQILAGLFVMVQNFLLYRFFIFHKK